MFPRRCLLALLLATLPVAACGQTKPYVWADRLPPVADPAQTSIAPRDTLLVDVRNQRELSGEFVVRDDGTYLHPTIGTVRAAGSTPPALAAALTTRLTGVIVDPQVTVSLARTAPIRVHVVGEVRTPGTYELPRDRSVTAALAAAGWLSEFAGQDAVYLVRAGSGSPRIRFRIRELTAADTTSSRFQLRDGDVVIVE